MTITTPARATAVRHLSAPATARLLGSWRATGPAYASLADALRAAVLAGSLPALTRLPSERDLASALHVSRTTTSAAYARLRELGFATSHVGSGTVTVLPRGGRHAGSTRPSAGDAPVTDLADEHAVDLAQATPDAVDALHGAYARALEALPAYLGTGGYAHLGLDTLRRAVARRYSARGVPTTADQVLVTTGAQQALAVLATTLVRRGETAVVESPTYFHGIEVLQRAGARVVGVPPGDVESLESAVRATGARLVYLVPDHHNPTGTSLDHDARRAVADLAARLDVTVVGDETLTDLDLDGVGPLPPLAGPGTHPRLVSVGSASKSFWGGLRVGWVRADRQLVHRLGAARQVLDIATPVLEQLAVAELLEVEHEILPGRRAALRARRDLLVDEVRERFPDWDVPRPSGGLCLWVGLGRPVAQPLAAAAVAEGLQLSPGPRFTPDGTAKDRVRLTYTRSPAVLADAVDRLERAWRRVTG
ncbi:GntR family transcriptional regulator [Isoptericola jiangsuensis]|uniref:GntR family transcriptional regulator n=1 Tax=Isoptericola jiangsuensis TaxID=548579 RepID=A0A2A9EYX3_9MICO|nr:PLP-dependent aminotransferase family protein [Isoptericola jiangsuensis]PFG43512.1 GntR family transcriptional regulator [Isoptericola jiangsuensis]